MKRMTQAIKTGKKPTECNISHDIYTSVYEWTANISIFV